MSQKAEKEAGAEGAGQEPEVKLPESPDEVKPSEGGEGDSEIKLPDEPEDLG